MKTLAMIGIVLATLAMPASGDDLEDGTRFLKNREYAKAAGSFRKAAEGGSAKAQFDLGSLYADGKGVTRDYKQAVYWFQKAAAQGDATAQLSLGYMCKDGLGVVKDNTQAAFWFEASAAQGNSIAMFSLHSLYSEGAAKNNVEAYKWALISSARGIPAAIEMTKVLELEMTREQVEDARRRAREWLNAHK